MPESRKMWFILRINCVFVLSKKTTVTSSMCRRFFRIFPSFRREPSYKPFSGRMSHCIGLDDKLCRFAVIVESEAILWPIANIFFNVSE